MPYHGIQQLAVRRFEAVDLRQGTGDDDAHGVGHIVGFQRIGDGRFQHLARREDLDVIAQLGPGSNDFFSFVLPSLFSLTQLTSK